MAWSRCDQQSGSALLGVEFTIHIPLQLEQHIRNVDWFYPVQPSTDGSAQESHSQSRLEKSRDTHQMRDFLWALETRSRPSYWMHLDAQTKERVKVNEEFFAWALPIWNYLLPWSCSLPSWAGRLMPCWNSNPDAGRSGPVPTPVKSSIISRTSPWLLSRWLTDMRNCRSQGWVSRFCNYWSNWSAKRWWKRLGIAPQPRAEEGSYRAHMFHLALCNWGM